MAAHFFQPKSGSQTGNSLEAENGTHPTRRIAAPIRADMLCVTAR